MGKLTEELLSSGFMNLGLKYFSVKNQVRKIKRKKYKIISTMFPVLNEIIYSTKAVPLFLPRLPMIGDYDDFERLISGTKLAENVLGKNLLSKGLGLVSSVVSIDDIILKQLDRIYENYKKYVEICEKSDYDIPCFGTKLFYGAVLKYSNIIDANLSFGTRCMSLNKSFEYISNRVVEDIYIDIPNCSQEDGHALDYTIDEVQKFISKLENMAGNIDDDKVFQFTELTNKIKQLYLEFFTIFKNKDYLPMGPKSFSHLLSLVNFIYIDLIAAPKYLCRNLKLLNQELIDRMKESKGYDASNSLKLLLLPSFGGFDAAINNFASERNAYIFYCDWYFWKMLDLINLKGDWVKNHSKFCLGVEKAWRSTQNIVKNWIEMINEFKIDGIIFNDITGCNTISAVEYHFKRELEKRSIPMVKINFHNIGENLEQTRTRINALIEMIRT